MNRFIQAYSPFGILLLSVLFLVHDAKAATLRAGAAKVEVTHPESDTRDEQLYVKALVITDGSKHAVLITVDAVAIGEIGPIKNSYLSTIRSQIEKEFGVPPAHVVANASHCHGRICDDIEALTVTAVRNAWSRMEDVSVGAGAGSENRIMENRRLRLKDGRTVDVRHAYSLAPDDEIDGVGPIDPEIGILRLDRLDGSPLAVLYNFACHPIQGVPGGTNTADITGFASRVIEQNLTPDCIALFFQGCGGDVNPIYYKSVDHPRDAETLGNLLGLSTLQAVRTLTLKRDADFRIINIPLALPRADLEDRIQQMERRLTQLLSSLQGTSINHKTFLPLAVKYQWSPEYPSQYAARYFYEFEQGRDGQAKLDAENRRQLALYTKNMLIMEEMIRVQTNLALLRKHQAQNVAASSRFIDVELVGLRVGEFVLVTSPGELTVQIGLNIKAVSPHPLTFVSGYTNGYIYYAPTEEQLGNPGGAQEDCDCILAPPWQKLFEARVFEVLRDL